MRSRALAAAVLAATLVLGAMPARAVLPEALVPRALEIRNAIDRYPAALTQSVMPAFLAEGHYAAHLRRARKRLRAAELRREIRREISARQEAAMAEAAAATRTGGLAVAEAEALTWAGPCRPGEILGISDGEVVLIAPDLAVGALWLAHRMLTPGGELVTVLLGSAAPDELGERFAEDLRRTHPEVDVVVHRGEQGDYPLVLGVE